VRDYHGDARLDTFATLVEERLSLDVAVPSVAVRDASHAGDRPL
jgi:hypothetical protein